MANLQSGNPRNFIIFNKIKGSAQDKQFIQEYLKHYLIKSDWYIYNELMNDIDLTKIRNLYLKNEQKKEERQEGLLVKVTSKILSTLSQLLNIKSLFIDTETIASHIDYPEVVVEDAIKKNKTLSAIISEHNMANFGVDDKERYKLIKKISLALLSHDSLTHACETAGISFREFLRHEDIIFGNYNYIHFELDKSDYVF